MFHYRGCTLIYQPLSYPHLSLEFLPSPVQTLLNLQYTFINEIKRLGNITEKIRRRGSEGIRQWLLKENLLVEMFGNHWFVKPDQHSIKKFANFWY